jgi:hypothetical protein
MTMPTNTTIQENIQQSVVVRQPFIPDDLGYMTTTEFGQEMTKLVAEIAAEQGTRTTEEINQLIDLMRGSASANADLS